MWTYHPALLARPVPRFTSYPTAAEFSDATGAAAQAEALARVAPGQAASLYVHIPFCREICWYCGCNTGRANRQQRLAVYLEALMAEIRTVAAQLDGRARIARVAFGGGSPNALSPDQFALLLGTLQDAFALESPTLSIEIDPRGFEADWPRRPDLRRRRAGPHRAGAAARVDRLHGRRAARRRYLVAEFRPHVWPPRTGRGQPA